MASHDAFSNALLNDGCVHAQCLLCADFIFSLSLSLCRVTKSLIESAVYCACFTRADWLMCAQL